MRHFIFMAVATVLASCATATPSPTMMESKMTTTTATATGTTTATSAEQRMQIDVKGTGGTPLVLVGGGLTGWASWEPHQARLMTKRTVARAQPLSVEYGLLNRPLPEG